MKTEKKETSQGIKKLHKIPFFERMVTRTVIFLFIAGSFSFILMNYFFIEFTDNIFRKNMGENGVLVVQQAMDKILGDVDKRVEYIQAYANDSNLQSAVEHSNKSFFEMDNLVHVIRERDRQWIEVPAGTSSIFIDNLLQNSLSSKLRELSHFFVEEYGYPVYPEIFVTNSYGANVGQTGRTSDYYQADEIWWQQAVAQGIYVGPVEYDKSAGVSSVDIAVAITNDVGVTIGVLKAVLDIQEVIDTIKNLTPQNNTEITKIHVAHGHHSHKSMSFTLTDLDDTLVYSTSLNTTYDLLDNREHNHAIISDINDYHFVVLDTGVEVLLAHATGFSHSSQIASGVFLPWVLTLEHEVVEVTKDTGDTFARLLVLASLIFSFTFVSTILFLLISVIYPISLLTNATNVATTGTFNEPIKIKGKGEIARLVTMFNLMMLSLKESQSHLEEKVQKRTKELRSIQLDLETKLAELEKFQNVTINRELKMIELKKEIEELKKQIKGRST